MCSAEDLPEVSEAVTNSYGCSYFLQAKIQDFLAKQHHSVLAFPSRLSTSSQKVLFFPLPPSDPWYLLGMSAGMEKLGPKHLRFLSSDPLTASSSTLPVPSGVGTRSENLAVCLASCQLSWPLMLAVY